ncbi:hypothetical protein [Arthrobacter alpinus]|uniref:hypothetical protein n=1 Tax=Arthrobacter alpinus TaxID=656366 RepID=UPI001114C3D1|nr:hypothetical protein [Arthrobacter alpinus]
MDSFVLQGCCCGVEGVIDDDEIVVAGGREWDGVFSIVSEGEVDGVGGHLSVGGVDARGGTVAHALHDGCGVADKFDVAMDATCVQSVGEFMAACSCGVSDSVSRFMGQRTIL